MKLKNMELSENLLLDAEDSFNIVFNLTAIVASLVTDDCYTKKDAIEELLPLIDLCLEMGTKRVNHMRINEQKQAVI